MARVGAGGSCLAAWLAGLLVEGAQLLGFRVSRTSLEDFADLCWRYGRFRYIVDTSWQVL